MSTSTILKFKTKEDINLDFYPTPKWLIKKMTAKIKGEPDYILEPSAGKGDIVDHLLNSWRFKEIAMIEKDPELNALLRGKFHSNCHVIDYDFLSYNGADKFDLIIANPPFSEGERHLLKAIQVMYCGQIIFLLNAEVIRNPYTNLRKVLKQKLEELNAEIEFIEDAFKDAERPAKVDVALISIMIERKVEDDLFKGMSEAEKIRLGKVNDCTSVSTGLNIRELVAEYNLTVDTCIKTIIDFYKRYPFIKKYIALNEKPESFQPYKDDLTAKMQHEVNELLKRIRREFWERALKLEAVTRRLTKKQYDAFYASRKRYERMEFTENNIRTFILNLIENYDKMLMGAVLEIFDRFTIRHSYNGGPFEKNIHYFNGWKTNKAFKVNHRVIIPIYASYGHPFRSWNGWQLDFEAARELMDIDLVMNYFDGCYHYHPMHQAIEAAFQRGQNRKILSTYFEVTCYKKGTIHLTFRDKDILRRFNLAACKGKGWLPQDYGHKPYQELTTEEKEVVDSFEGKASYEKHRKEALFSHDIKELLALPEAA